MHARTYTWSPTVGWLAPNGSAGPSVRLVLVFGDVTVLAAGDAVAALQARHPGAVVVAVSTAGEIAGETVFEGTATALAMHFDRTTVRPAQVAIAPGEPSEAIAERLAAALSPEGLAHVLLFSDGLHVNGSALARGLAVRLPERVAITGGLAGDGDRFRETWVGVGADVFPRQVVAVGLYGDALRVGYGSVGGWDVFGPERIITRSAGNVLVTLDHQPALELYKRYLGEAAADLPSSALHFPLALTRRDGAPPVVRTILSLDDAAGTMTFAGDVPEGATVRLMRANFDRLVDGAEQSALDARQRLGSDASAAILVSCVGRRLVLRQRVEDELEGVRRVLGPTPAIAGFYSYGEITPVAAAGRCELHNQTMTITTLVEA